MEEEYLLTDYFLEKEIPLEYHMFFNFSNGKLYFDKSLSIDDAYKLISVINDLSGCFTTGSKIFIGVLKNSYTHEKCCGIQSKDGKVRWRIDCDKINGVHLHYENYILGKGNKSIKVLIPLNIEYKSYKKIIDKNTKRLLKK